MADLVIGDALSSVWADALAVLLDRGGQAVNLNAVFDANFDDDPLVRERLDALLAQRGKGSVETVANTIFPDALYARHLGAAAAQHLYKMHDVTMGLHRRRRANDRDTYFNRLVAYPTARGPFNQLEHVIERLRGQVPLTSPNSSAYEMGTSEPTLDGGEMLPDLRVHVPGKDRNIYGFPCLSHVSLTFERPRLHLTAVYRNQTFVERAYGNYIGLQRLLRFVCTETDCLPGEVQCTATHASAQIAEHSRTRVERLLMDVRSLIDGTSLLSAHV